MMLLGRLCIRARASVGNLVSRFNFVFNRPKMASLFLFIVPAYLANPHWCRPASACAIAKQKYHRPAQENHGFGSTRQIKATNETRHGCAPTCRAPRLTNLRLTDKAWATSLEGPRFLANFCQLNLFPAAQTVCVAKLVVGLATEYAWGKPLHIARKGLRH